MENLTPEERKEFANVLSRIMQMTDSMPYDKLSGHFQKEVDLIINKLNALRATASNRAAS